MNEKSMKLNEDSLVNDQSDELESALVKGYGLLIEKLDTPNAIYQWLTCKQKVFKDRIFNFEQLDL